MPRPRKAPRPVWHPKDREYFIHDGTHRERTGIRDEADVVGSTKKLAEYLNRQGPVVAPKNAAPDSIKLEVLLELYATARSGTAGYITLLNCVKMLLPFWGEKTVNDVTEANCVEFGRLRAIPRRCAARNGKPGRLTGAGPEKVRRDLGVLQSAMIYGVKNGIITSMRSVTLPKGGKVRGRYLERLEVAWLIKASPPHLRRFILVSLDTGRRETAVLDLKWKKGPGGGWVDFRRGTLWFLEPDGTESDKKRGACKAPSKLLSHLSRWKRLGGEHVVDYDNRFDNDWHTRKDARLDPKRQAAAALKDQQREEERDAKRVDNVKRAFKAACRRAMKMHAEWVERTGRGDELEALNLFDVSPHTLKHTAITWFYIGGGETGPGVEFFDTSEKTMQKYRKHSPEHQAAALSVVSRGGRPPRPPAR